MNNIISPEQQFIFSRDPVRNMGQISGLTSGVGLNII